MEAATSRVMYEVAVHTVDTHWSLPRPRDRWLRVSRRPLGRVKAISVCNELAEHAVVCEWDTSNKIHDNGKNPGTYVPPPAPPAPSRGRRIGSARPEFPRIVRFFQTIDAPDSECPCCGATGRYIVTFQVEDGRRLGAMRGCLTLFPVSPIAQEELRLREKLESLQKRFGETAMLNRNDRGAMDAIQAFYEGIGDEPSVLAIVTAAKRANAARHKR